MGRTADGSTTKSAENVSIAASRVSEPELLPVLSTRQIGQKRGGKRVENRGFFGSVRLKIHRQ